MTLIITQIDKFGILHASDSNLTSPENKVSEGKKVFDIPYLRSGLSIAGSYGVGKTPMDTWMEKFIEGHKIEGMTLEKFAYNLRDSLQSIMTNEQKKQGSMIQLAGFVEEDEYAHPEFWFIRTVHKINKNDGNYEDIDTIFEITEDFWSRDSKDEGFRIAAKDPNLHPVQKYFNGFAPGRIGYYNLSQELGNFFKKLWGNSDWSFRPPKSLEERRILIECYMQVIDTVFRLSDYKARYIGGTTQTLEISAPQNLRLCK